MDKVESKPVVVLKPEPTARNGKSVVGLSATEKKALILEALLKEGYSAYQAAQILGVSKQLTYRIDRQVRQGILTPFIKKARKSVGMLIDGELVGKMTEIKGSDVLTASKIVLDRYEPIITRIEQKSMSVKIDLTDEEREKYHKLLGLVPQQLIEEEKK